MTFRFAFMAVLLAGLALAWPSRQAAAQAVRGEVTAVVDNGYARLTFLMTEEVESQVRVANNILTISFARPVSVAVDKLSVNGAGYIAAARRDPDGRAIRIALARKVTVNSMAAAERLFVDLLPDTWTGQPPGLPREVIEDLARRTREAEKKVRQQRALERQKQNAMIRVRAITQPTFSRYVFDLPELIGVSADNGRDKLTLTFDSALRFDLADVQATLPSTIESVDAEVDQDAAVVRFSFSKKVDVRTFREDNSYVVDVSSVDARATREEGSIRSDELASVAAEPGRKPSVQAEKPPATPKVIERPASVPQQPAAPVTPPQQPAASAAPPPGTLAKSSEPPKEQATTPRVERPAATVETKDEQGASPSAASAPAAAAAPQASASPSPAVPSPPAGEAGAAVRAALKRVGNRLTLQFPFAEETPAAVFRRADALWLVFDTDAPISLAGLDSEIGRSFRAATVMRMRNVTVVRIKLERPLLVSATSENGTWAITLGSEVTEPTRPLSITRNVFGTSRSSVAILVDDPRDLHRIDDPDAGDTLFVVTALGPARGFVKTHSFVEFRVLTSTHGVALQPLADDLTAQVETDKVIVSRPTGLALSAAANTSSFGPGQAYQRHVFDPQSWGFDRQANFLERRSELLHAAADAPEPKRPAARADLARFYLARDMASEAKAVLDVSITDHPPTAAEPGALVLRAVCNIMIGRPDAALKDLGNPFVGAQLDAPVWRAFAYSRLGKWTDAREGFRNIDTALGSLPLELQRAMMKEMVRASIEVGDITDATQLLNEFEAIGVPREYEPAISVLAGRLAEALGHPDEARRDYQMAADSWDRPSAAQGRLREIVLRRRLGALDRPEAVAALETLTTIWRGDATEVEALQLLARLYTEDERYRDAFQIMRTALSVHPNSEMTRGIQEEAAATFDSVFLAGKGDALPAIEALALFYDFRELTPIGRRGDEMIRRLADRLVSVDLLQQAAELLQYQVDHRLQGAARAQVATRLAVIYLMNRRPDRALVALRTTRIADLNSELRNQRLLLEARALSESGRHDVALEVVANVPGREAIRARADILWAARRWAAAAEQLELLYGDRWQEFEPLNDAERPDILRAAIGYALGEDSIGLGRFRERYAAKMGDGPDRRAFDIVTAPVGVGGIEFTDIARAIASVDTLDGFLRDLRARYPLTGAAPSSQIRPLADPPRGTPTRGPATTGTVRPSRPPSHPPSLPTSRTASAR